jgi:hypothetical protein
MRCYVVCVIGIISVKVLPSYSTIGISKNIIIFIVTAKKSFKVTMNCIIKCSLVQDLLEILHHSLHVYSSIVQKCASYAIL